MVSSDRLVDRRVFSLPVRGFMSGEALLSKRNTMFKRLYADNYRCFVNFAMDFEDITLLTGYNGSGKTSVLDIMFALRELLGGRAKITDPDIFPANSLTAWQTKKVQTFELDVVLKEDELRYRLEIEHNVDQDLARISTESLSSRIGGKLFLFEGGEVRLYRDDHSEGPIYHADWRESALARVPSRNDNTRLTTFLNFIRHVLVCGIYPAGFEHETARHDLMLERDASNFSSWYLHVQLEDPGQVEAFRKAIAKVIDGLDQIRLPKTGLNTRAMMVDFHGNDSRYELSLDKVSDGQRTLIALYALIHLSSGLGYTLCLDEPENYIALAEIQPWLVELADRCGDSIPQALICSHHPEMIDFLGPAHGLFLHRERSGATKVNRLKEVALVPESALRMSEILARGWENAA